jgi:hypothetical protein
MTLFSLSLSIICFGTDSFSGSTFVDDEGVMYGSGKISLRDAEVMRTRYCGFSASNPNLFSDIFSIPFTGLSTVFSARFPRVIWPIFFPPSGDDAWFNLQYSFVDINRQ